MFIYMNVVLFSNLADWSIILKKLSENNNFLLGCVTFLFLHDEISIRLNYKNYEIPFPVEALHYVIITYQDKVIRLLTCSFFSTK